MVDIISLFDGTGSSVYMIASTVSSKMLQAMAREEGFLFEVSLHWNYLWHNNAVTFMLCIRNIEVSHTLTCSGR